MAAQVTCIAPGVTVAGIDQARAFVPGDVIDLDAVVATRAGGAVVTWRDVLGGHVDSHFVQTSALAGDSAPAEPRRRRSSTAAPTQDADAAE